MPMHMRRHTRRSGIGARRETGGIQAQSPGDLLDCLVPPPIQRQRVQQRGHMPDQKAVWVKW